MQDPDRTGCRVWPEYIPRAKFCRILHISGTYAHDAGAPPGQRTLNAMDQPPFPERLRPMPGKRMRHIYHRRRSRPRKRQTPRHSGNKGMQKHNIRMNPLDRAPYQGNRIKNHTGKIPADGMILQRYPGHLPKKKTGRSCGQTPADAFRIHDATRRAASIQDDASRRHRKPPLYEDTASDELHRKAALTSATSSRRKGPTEADAPASAPHGASSRISTD